MAKRKWTIIVDIKVSFFRKYGKTLNNATATGILQSFRPPFNT